MRRRRGVEDERLLCSGPGRLCEALGITRSQNELALDQPPFALYARQSKPEMVIGLRVGLTKAVDLPWRYGLAGSRFLSKPFRTVPAVKTKPPPQSRGPNSGKNSARP
jgi:DNA-3-methyladenine glycosylase